MGWGCPQAELRWGGGGGSHHSSKYLIKILFLCLNVTRNTSLGHILLENMLLEYSVTTPACVHMCVRVGVCR